MPEGRYLSAIAADCSTLTADPSPSQATSLTHSFICCCHCPLCTRCAVHFVGELRSCSGFLPPRLALTGGTLSSLSAHWQIYSRDERIWRHVEGDASGNTWLAHREEVGTRTHTCEDHATGGPARDHWMDVSLLQSAAVFGSRTHGMFVCLTARCC